MSLSRFWSLHVTNDPTLSAGSCPPGVFIIWGWRSPPCVILRNDFASCASWMERGEGLGACGVQLGCGVDERKHQLQPRLLYLRLPSAPTPGPAD